MATPSNTHYDINYHTGWVIVTNAIDPRPPYKELRGDAPRALIRRKVLKDGIGPEGLKVLNMTDSMEDWERRRTRTNFKRPKGMFLYRIIDTTGQNRIGTMELNEWPQR